MTFKNIIYPQLKTVYEKTVHNSTNIPKTGNYIIIPYNTIY